MMKQKIDNCHQLEWVRGYLEAAMKNTNSAMMNVTYESDFEYYRGKFNAYERMLRAINETFEGGTRK